MGVYEFDTVSKVFVATHNIDKELGFGAVPMSNAFGSRYYCVVRHSVIVVDPHIYNFLPMLPQFDVTSFLMLQLESC